MSSITQLLEEASSSQQFGFGLEFFCPDTDDGFEDLYVPLCARVRAPRLSAVVLAAAVATLCSRRIPFFARMLSSPPFSCDLVARALQAAAHGPPCRHRASVR